MQPRFAKFWQAKEFAIFVVLLVMCVIVTIINPVFIRVSNIADVLLTNSVLGIMSLGMLTVILTGGIDVSVAAIIAMVTVVIGHFMMKVTGNLIVVFLLGIGIGGAAGLINGLLIAKIKLHPIVVTLGTMNIIYGIMLYLTGGAWVRQDQIPNHFKEFGMIKFGHFSTWNGGSTGLPVQLFFLVVAVIVTWFLLRFTMFGRGIYAIGGNRASAERAGFRIDRIIILTYLFEGLLVGLAGVVQTSIVRQADPEAFVGFELQVIAAVVIGGTSILGGSGSVLGTVLGVGLIALLNNALTLMRISSYWQKVAVGLVIIAAVTTDVVQKRRAEAKETHVDVVVLEEAEARDES